MRNKIKSTTFIVMSVFLLLFCYDNANAVDVGSSNCTANSSATFNFNVQPAITIVATNPVLENLCPGCGRSWACGEGPYIQWDITGSLECRYDIHVGNVVHCIGDNNASIDGCWKELRALPDTWGSFQPGNPNTFFNGNGIGIGKLRFYLESQTSNCNASGNYCWCIDVTVDYVCGLIEILGPPCPTCPPL